MNRIAIAALGLFAWGSAQAQNPFTIDPAVLLNSSAASYTNNGVGSPAVAWDSDRSRYVMVFETSLDNPANPGSSCPVGTWGLGMAFSTDGINWTTTPGPILEPTAGTYYACVAAHPTVMYNNDRLRVWFKAEQEGTGTADLSRYTGIGHVEIVFRSTGTIQSVTPSNNPAFATTNFNVGNPKVVANGGNLNMLVNLYPNMYFAVRSGVSIPTGFFLANLGSPVLTPNGSTPLWYKDEVFNGALVCEDDPTFPLLAFQGGRNYNAGSIINAGWGESISADGLSWTLATTEYFSWANNDDWRHWDALRVGTSDYLVFFAEKDGGGRNQVRLAYTNPSWNPADTYDKVCN